MKKVYFISGIGADKRIFSLLDLSFCEPVFIEWIKPLKNESLSSYAMRLREQMTELSPTVVGISLGGMLVTEMAKADKTIKAIIISSNKTSSEFPFYLKIGKYFPVYKWSPQSVSKKIMLQSTWLLGGKTIKEKLLLKQVIKDTDMNFVKWAIGAIMHWGNKTVPGNLIHIHGTEDKVLPYRYVKADYTLKNGTHVMTLDKHEELSSLLRQLIQ